MSIQDVITAKFLPNLEEMLSLYKTQPEPGMSADEIIIQTIRQMNLAAMYMGGHSICVSALEYQTHDRQTLIQFTENHQRDIAKFNEKLLSSQPEKMTGLNLDNQNQNKATMQAQADFMMTLAKLVSDTPDDSVLHKKVTQFLAERQKFEADYWQRSASDPDLGFMFVS